VARELEVTELRISRRTAEKILTAHKIHEDEVRAAVEGVGGLPFSWDEDDERGGRALIVIAIRGEPALIVLYPAEGELGTVWNLGSAYFIEEWEDG
jgi:hypothetical protein